MNSIIEEIKDLKYAEPFVAFELLTISGDVYRIDNSDHVGISEGPWSRLTGVRLPDGSHKVLYEYQIIRVTKCAQQEPAAQQEPPPEFLGSCW